MINKRDITKHEYSLVPIIDGQHRWGKRLYVGDWQGTADGNCQTGENHSIAKAQELLAARPEVQRYHLYHTYPSPGPVDRFVGAILRDKEIVRAA